jgi:hypothetical protein
MVQSFPRSAVVIFLFFLFSLFPLNADSFFNQIHWAFNGSMLYFGSDNGIRDADTVKFIPSAGASASVQLRGPFWLGLTEDIYFSNYEYNSALGYPMACNAENRSAFVMGFVTGLQLTCVIPISRTGMGVRIFAGPVMDIRLVVLAFGLNHPDDFTGNLATDARLQTEAIRSYFWSRGRWFLPVAGMGFDFPVNDRFLLGLDFRCWFPLYRQWTNEEIPAIDGWRFGLGFRITPRRNVVRSEPVWPELPIQIQPRTETPVQEPQIEIPVQIQFQEEPQTETEAEIEIQTETEEQTDSEIQNDDTIELFGNFSL